MKDTDTLDPSGNNGSSTGAFFVGLLCGAAIGAAAGLLLAPKTGVEMRQQVAESTDQLRRKASAAYDSASQVINDAVARGKDAIQVGRETFQRSRPGNGSVGDASSMP